MDSRTATLSKSAAAGESPRALCHGLVAADFLARTAFPVPRDVKVRVNGFVRQGGGPAANAAVAIARLGGRAAFAGAVGDDAIGRAQIDELRREGVDVTGVAAIPGAPSFVSFILVDDADGSRTIFSAPEGRPLLPDAADALPSPRPHLVLVDGWGGTAQREVARRAHAEGIPVLLDAGTLRDEVVELLPFTEVAIVSAPFADAFADGRGDATALRKILELGPRLAAVTRGESGAVAAALGGEPFEVAAFEVDVVDTTGAGDAFHGGAAWALMSGRGWEESLRIAAAVAALKCRRRGARAGLPRREELEGFLARLTAPE